MDLLSPNSLANIVCFLEQGSNPEMQQQFFDTLNQLKAHPQFIFSLLKIVLNQEVNFVVRINAASLIKQQMKTILPEHAQLFINEANGLFYVLQTPLTSLVRVVAGLVGEIYHLFRKNYNLVIFPNATQILTATIQNPSFCENAFIFAIELLNSGYNIGVSFASLLPNFIISPFSEYSIKTASLMPLFASDFKNTILPIIFQNLNNISQDSLFHTCILVENILKDDRNDQNLLNFMISCLQSDCEAVAIEAAKTFQENQMIQLQELTISNLYLRLGNDFNLNMYNLSYQFIKTLKILYRNSKEKVHPILIPLIHESLNSQNEVSIRCAVRAMSFIEIEEEAEKKLFFDHLWCFLNSSFCCDALFSLMKRSKNHTEIIIPTFNRAFQILGSATIEHRIVIETYLSKLLNNIEIESEPYLSSLMQLLQSTKDEEEIHSLMFLIGSLCNCVKTFEQNNNFNDFIRLILDILSSRSFLLIECLYIFSSIISKRQDTFPVIFGTIGQIAQAILSSPLQDVKETEYAFYFFSQAIEGSNKFNQNIFDIITQICDIGIKCLDPNIPEVIQKSAWLFFYSIICYSKQFFDMKLKIPILQAALFMSEKKDLSILGIECQLLSEYLDMYGDSLGDEIKYHIYHLCMNGLEFSTWDGDLDRQNIAFCLMKLIFKTPEFIPTPELIDTFQNICEYLNPSTKSTEFVNQLQTLMERQPL